MSEVEVCATELAWSEATAEVDGGVRPVVKVEDAGVESITDVELGAARDVAVEPELSCCSPHSKFPFEVPQSLSKS